MNPREDEVSDERGKKPTAKNDEGERDDDVEAHVKPRPATGEPSDADRDDDVEAHIRVKQ